MILAPHRVCFSDPAAKLSVKILKPGYPERVNMVPGRNGLDSTKATGLHAARQDNMTIQPAAPGSNLGKGHADLKGDPGFFRQNPDRSERADDGDDPVVEPSDLRRFSLKMIGEPVAAAGVGLIAIRKPTPALLAGPHGPGAWRRQGDPFPPGLKPRAAKRRTQASPRLMRRVAAPAAQPMRIDVPPQMMEASPPARVRLTIRAPSMRRFHRRHQNVVTRLSAAKRPKANWVTVWMT